MAKINYEQFKDLIKRAVNCLVLPYCVKYRLDTGERVIAKGGSYYVE